MAYKTVNPYTNETIATFPDLKDAELESLLSQAEKTYKSWRGTSFADRAGILHKAARLLRDKSEDYAKLLTLEMGKLKREALGEVALSADILDYYAEHAEQFLAPQQVPGGSERGDDAVIV
ncbi:MAG: aldehyde dehydrogenase family protein, partial [Acetobacter persici]